MQTEAQQTEPPPNDAAAAQRLEQEIARRRQAVTVTTETVLLDVPAMSAVIAGAISGAIGRSKPRTDEELRGYAWRHEIRERLEASRIPERYRYELREWIQPKQKAVYDSCRRTFTGTGAIIALVGTRGVGKTTIASQLIIARAWEDHQRLDAGEPGFLWRLTPYRKMSDLISRFKALYADFGSLDMDTLISARASYCSDTTLAIIDELHDCEDQRMKDRVLTDILDRRYSEMNDTLLIDNQTDEAFRKSVSDSVLSRITEHGLIIPCNWGSFRDELRQHARHA